jgi:hypothetical protein
MLSLRQPQPGTCCKTGFFGNFLALAPALGFMPSRRLAARRLEGRGLRGGAPPGQLLRDGDRVSRQLHLGPGPNGQRILSGCLRTRKRKVNRF